MSAEDGNHASAMINEGEDMDADETDPDDAGTRPSEAQCQSVKASRMAKRKTER